MGNDDALSESIQMIKAGRKAEAQLVLEPYIRANPHDIKAWSIVSSGRLPTRLPATTSGVPVWPISK